MSDKLWGGRFEKATDSRVDDFHSSIGFDWRLYQQDIAGSIAHATMLGETGIITTDEADDIVAGLEGILQDIKDGKVAFDVAAEDIHMNIEQLLTQRIGEAGKKLHTGRSRNDQVALDTRLFVMDACNTLQNSLKTLLTTLMQLSQNHLNTAMPGYTHLQRAQPVTLAHHLMAYFQMYRRDCFRLVGARDMADSMPLGSGALAGTTFHLDRGMVADQLGFTYITHNSLDAVSDRDYVCDFVYACSMIMMHTSRLCEELILWSSQEFGFVNLDDAFATGSSIMPQKKNPDVAELARGKTGRVYGDLMTLLTLMKGLPLAYNKDMQEDKEALFDAFDTANKVISLLAPMLSSGVFNVERMRKAALDGFANATDVADYLVKKGIPFREAHAISGQLVKKCIEESKNLLDLTMDDWHRASLVFSDDIRSSISLETCLNGRNLAGGPAPEAVHLQLMEAEKWLKDFFV